MKRLLNTSIIGILALIFPVAALANVTGTQTLTTAGPTTLDLDTGVAGTSGGDILWTGTGISMQGNATELNLTTFGYSASSLPSLSQFLLTQFGSYSSSPLPLGALTVNNIFAVLTNYGNYAAPR